MLIRTKDVEKDGAQFTIGSLSLRQVRAWQDAIKAYREKTPQDNDAALKIMVEFVVCPSLNNALKAKGAQTEPYTVESVMDMIDYVMLDFIREAVMKFNGFDTTPRVNGQPPEVKRTGEPETVSTSQPSGPVSSPQPAGQ